MILPMENLYKGAGMQIGSSSPTQRCEQCLANMLKVQHPSQLSNLLPWWSIFKKYDTYMLSEIWLNRTTPQPTLLQYHTRGSLRIYPEMDPLAHWFKELPIKRSNHSWISLAMRFQSSKDHGWKIFVKSRRLSQLSMISLSAPNPTVIFQEVFASYLSRCWRGHRSVSMHRKKFHMHLLPINQSNSEIVASFLPCQNFTGKHKRCICLLIAYISSTVHQMFPEEKKKKKERKNMTQLWFSLIYAYIT